MHEFRTDARHACTPSPTSRSTCEPGETLGIVGETGSGKSTLARCVLQAPRPKAGSVRFPGTDLVGLRGARLCRPAGTCRWSSRTRSARSTRRGGSRDIVEEPLIGYAGDGRPAPARGRVLDLVGLDPGVRRPAARASCPAASAQRVAIARAIALSPGADRLRRAGVLARRADPGPGAQPVGAAAHRARACPTCSSRTTSPWSSRSVTGWR